MEVMIATHNLHSPLFLFLKHGILRIIQIKLRSVALAWRVQICMALIVLATHRAAGYHISQAGLSAIIFICISLRRTDFSF
ncbi:hypothetical protein FKM82_023992 [Ascaphus truei]